MQMCSVREAVWGRVELTSYNRICREYPHGMATIVGIPDVQQVNFPKRAVDALTYECRRAGIPRRSYRPEAR